MFRFHAFVALFITGTFFGLGDCGSQASGEDFRVNNEVFPNGQKEPANQSITIFHDGVVYDSMKSPAEIVVFEKTAGRFVLMNPASQTRTELTTADITTFVNQLQARAANPTAAKNPDPVVRFLADPKFQERYDESMGELTLTSPMVSYRLVLATGLGQTTVEQYRDFSDWYARLNTLLTPGARPPFGRLAVNEAVAKRKAIASQVILAVASGKASGRPTTIRTTHQIVRQLTQTDLDYVAKIRKMMTDFQPVSFDKYRKSELK
jgi:hypothetical protein